jgi:hypothetical protein
MRSTSDRMKSNTWLTWLGTVQKASQISICWSHSSTSHSIPWRRSWTRSSWASSLIGSQSRSSRSVLRTLSRCYWDANQCCTLGLNWSRSCRLLRSEKTSSRIWTTMWLRVIVRKSSSSTFIVRKRLQVRRRVRKVNQSLTKTLKRGNSRRLLNKPLSSLQGF